MHTRKTRPATTPPTCGTCRYFVVSEKFSKAGDCRRNPPQLVVTANGVSGAFPGVDKDRIWCGEWQRTSSARPSSLLARGA